MNNLKILRKKAGLTLRELADKTNINFSTLGKLERGDTSLSDEYIKILSAYFNVSSDYLLGLTPNPTPQHNIKMVPLVDEKRSILKYVPLILEDKEDIIFMRPLKKFKLLSRGRREFYDNDMFLAVRITAPLNTIHDLYDNLYIVDFKNYDLDLAGIHTLDDDKVIFSSQLESNYNIDLSNYFNGSLKLYKVIEIYNVYVL